MIRVKKGFILRNMKDQSFVIPIGEMTKEFKGMIRLNETSTYYWKELEKGTTKEELLANAEKTFKGVDAATLEKDLEEFLDTIDFCLEKV